MATDVYNRRLFLPIDNSQKGEPECILYDISTKSLLNSYDLTCATPLLALFVYLLNNLARFIALSKPMARLANRSALWLPSE